MGSTNGKKPSTSPQTRYDEFAKQNREWDRKVAKSIERIGKSREVPSKRAARER